MEKPYVINDSDEEQNEELSQNDLFEVQNPAVDNKQKTDPEEMVGDTEAQVQNILGNFGGDIKKALLKKKKSMKTCVKACIKDSNQKFEQIWKMKQRESKKLHNEFSKQYMNMFHQWDMNIQKLDEKQEKLANNIQKQQKGFKRSKTDHNQALQAIRQLHDKFIKSLKNLEKSNYDLLNSSQGELKREMSAFKRNLMTCTLKYSSAYKTSK